MADRSLARVLRGRTGDHRQRPSGEPRRDQRAVTIAAEVGNSRAEATAQTTVNQFQSAVLSGAELAAELIRVLRQLHDSGDTTTNALLTLSQAMELLNGAGNHTTAALICGWLDGRSGRNMQGAAGHLALVASVRQSVGDQWDLLFQQGRSLSNTQLFDIACEELGTID